MIIASMASLSSRAELLERTIKSLEHQVDAFCIYLNGYPRVPEFLRHPKVLHAVLSVEVGWRGAEAKLWFWDDAEFRAAPRWNKDDLVLVCDDDLIYPSNYVSEIVDARARHPGAVICTHGSIMTEPFERYSVSRMVARTVAGLERDTQVHIPGTGTMAFRFGDVAGVLDGALRRDFQWSHAVDPHMAVICHKAGIPVWSIARPPRWVVTQELPCEGTAIFMTRTGAGSDVQETAILRAAAPWPTLPIAPDMTSRSRDRCVQHAPANPHHGRHRPILPSMSSMLPEEAFAWLSGRFGGLPAGVVIELGSGFGTERLLQSLPAPLSLISVEHDQRFVGLIEGAGYIYAPIHNGWYDTRTLAAKLPQRGSIVAVIVDGPPSKIGRARLCKNLDLFPATVPMLIDDVHRPAELEMARQIASSRGQPLDIVACDGRAFATVGWAN